MASVWVMMILGGAIFWLYGLIKFSCVAIYSLNKTLLHHTYSAFKTIMIIECENRARFIAICPPHTCVQQHLIKSKHVFPRVIIFISLHF